MNATLTNRVRELVEFGWEPTTSTDTTASLVRRMPRPGRGHGRLGGQKRTSPM